MALFYFGHDDGFGDGDDVTQSAFKILHFQGLVRFFLVRFHCFGVTIKAFALG